MSDYDQAIFNSEGGALVPETMATEIIKELPQKSCIMGKAKKLPNMPSSRTRMPVLSMLPVAYFVDAPAGASPSGLKKTTKMAWENKYLDAAEIACIVPVPEAMIDDSNYPIWAEVKPYLVEAIGLTFDSAVMYGLNAPAVWPQNIVQGAIDHNNWVTDAEGADLYDALFAEGGLLSKLELDGFFADGYIGALNMRSKMRGLRDEEGRPMFYNPATGKGYELDGNPIEFPRNGSVDPESTLLIAADWSKIVWTLRQDIAVKVLTESVITDNSTPPQILFNLAQQDMVALRVTMRAAWQVPNPVNRINGIAASRYPVAVLRPNTAGSGS